MRVARTCKLGLESPLVQMKLWKKGFCLVRPTGLMQIYSARRVEGGSCLITCRWRHNLQYQSKVLNVSPGILWINILEFGILNGNSALTLGWSAWQPLRLDLSEMVCDQTNQLPQRGKGAGAAYMLHHVVSCAVREKKTIGKMWLARFQTSHRFSLLLCPSKWFSFSLSRLLHGSETVIVIRGKLCFVS